MSRNSTKPKMRYLNYWILLLLAAALLSGGGCTKQARARRHVDRGEKYFATEDYEKAEIEYLSALNSDSTNRAAIRRLGAIYFADDVTLPALAFLNSAKKSDPQDFESRGKLARLYLNAGAVRPALEEANLVLKNVPTNENALLVIVDAARRPEDGKALEQTLAALRQKAGDKSIFHAAGGFLRLKLQDPVGAEAEFKKAIELDSKSEVAHWALGGLYWSQNKLAEAEAELQSASSVGPIRSNRRQRLVEFKLEKKDIAGARGILKDVTKRAPDFLPGWILTSRVALLEKSYPEALSAVERVLARNPNHYEAATLHADIRVAEGKFDLAVADLDRLALVYTNSPAVRYQAATAHLLTRDFPGAISSLNQALTIDSNHVPSILMLAELNLRRGQAPSVIGPMADLIKKQPGNERAYSLLASAYLSLERPEEAIRIYKDMIRAFPNSLDGLFLLANAYRQARNPAEARNTLEQILKKSPDNARATTQLVELDIQAKAYDAAIRRVQEQMTKYPKQPQPVFLMATIRKAQNNLPEAQALLEKVIEMDPESTGAYLLMASVYREAKNVPSAIQKLNAAIAKNPKDLAALTMLGTIYTETGDQKKAEETYQKVLNVNSNAVVALNNLASFYSQEGQVGKAYDLARRAEDLVPSDPYISDTFGWILSQRGEFGLALNLLREAARSMPKAADVQEHLGLTYYWSGDEKFAREILEKAEKLGTNSSPDAKKALAILSISPAGDPGARVMLEQHLAAKPSDVVALSRLGAIYRKEGATDKLYSLYEKGAAANPKSGLILARMAELQFERGNQAKALELARNARNLSPEDPEVGRIAGRIGLQSRDSKDELWALSLLEQTRQQRPNDPDVLYTLALAYYSQGRLSEAEITVKDALKAGPISDSANARRLLDFLPLNSSPAQPAQLPMIDAALKTDPNYVPALVAKAVASESRGEKDQARSAWEKVLAHHSSFAPAIRSMAILHIDRPNDPKAYEYANRARELYPNDPLVAKALGMSAYGKRDYARAAQVLSQAVAKSPQDPELQFYLGMSHFQLRQMPQSKAALEKAVALAPNAAFVSEARQTLASLK